MIGLFLKGKTAVITGSTSGIGAGIAKMLSAAGANIILNGFGPEAEIKQLQASLTNSNSAAKHISADISRPEDCQGLIDQAVKHFGKVDILVNNAGIQHIDRVEDFPIDKWNSILAINLSSAFYTTRSALPGMKQRQWGRIINIASVHGLVASVNKSAYVASKFGVVGFTKAVALENAKDGVTVNAICPGWVLTPLIQKQIELKAQANNLSLQEAQKLLLSEKQPSCKFSKPEDVGALAAFLCSDNAHQITGSAMTMDGAWTSV